MKVLLNQAEISWYLMCTSRDSLVDINDSSGYKCLVPLTS